MYHEFCTRKEWDTPEQNRLVSVYDIFSFTNLGLVGLVILITGARIVKNYYFMTYEVS